MPDVNDDILNSEEELSDEQLLNYLRGYLSHEDAHDIEEQMIDDSFVNDAIEGLQQFSSTKNWTIMYASSTNICNNKRLRKNSAITSAA